jgi:hypothetical protein
MVSAGALMLGQESHRCEILRDDFHGEWLETKVVSEDPKHKSLFGKIHYYQILERDKTLSLRPGIGYNFEVVLQPDIVRL